MCPCSLWVTPYSESEKFPGGNYPLQNVATGGVAEWVKQGRSIAAGSDPVVWHVFGEAIILACASTNLCTSFVAVHAYRHMMGVWQHSTVAADRAVQQWSD